MIVNTADLKGSALDWAVAKCEGIDLPHGLTDAVRYSTNWCLGGPIIEREKITLSPWVNETWGAIKTFQPEKNGPTPLIAAMRCYVSEKMGAIVDVPKEFR